LVLTCMCFLAFQPQFTHDGLLDTYTIPKKPSVSFSFHNLLMC
jgi:hypothetical protein